MDRDTGSGLGWIVFTGPPSVQQSMREVLMGRLFVYVRACDWYNEAEGGTDGALRSQTQHSPTKCHTLQNF